MKSEILGKKQKDSASYKDDQGIMRFSDDDQPLSKEGNLIPMRVFDKETGQELIKMVDSRKPWMKRLDSMSQDMVVRPTLRKFSEAVWRHGGNLTEVAAFFGVNRYTVTNRWMKAKPYRQVVEEIKEAILDYAEDALDDMVMNGNIIATIFKLKTLGKSRGYIEDQGRDTNLNQTIKVKVSKR